MIKNIWTGIPDACFQTHWSNQKIIKYIWSHPSTTDGQKWWRKIVISDIFSFCRPLFGRVGRRARLQVNQKTRDSKSGGSKQHNSIRTWDLDHFKRKCEYDMPDPIIQWLWASHYVKPFGPVVNNWARAAISVGTKRRITIKYDILVFMYLNKINDSGQLCGYVS